MDSISYITKKHCRSFISVLCILLLTVIAAYAVVFALDTHHMVVGLLAALLSLEALSAWILLIAPSFGSTLMQIPTGLLAAVFFAASLTLPILGYLFAARRGMQAYVNHLLEHLGYRLVTRPAVTGIIISGGGVLAFMMTCLLVLGVRYLRTFKRCLHDDIRRSGTRAFGVLSYVMALCILVAVAGFLYLAGDDRLRLLADRTVRFTLSELTAAALLFFCTGLLAGSFLRRTFAFKVFEDRMMKVETNADGTVYVPISEDTADENGETVPAPVVLSGRADDRERPRCGKPCISEFSHVHLVYDADGKVIHSENESFVL